MYYYKKGKAFSANHPGEPSPVKTKIRQCVMEWYNSSLLLRNGTEYSDYQWKWW